MIQTGILGDGMNDCETLLNAFRRIIRHTHEYEKASIVGDEG